eukprot:TRINITY_DN7435_c0_g1_i1.p1 TRINITY_DN7435_c0_g1~~TRINITY_DN7435_c0_g1_i1.p1  ORF type:complete len:325 (+),score=94.34 TRINITY_DN7435_c0_g1_i1:38-976(+)
MKTTTTRGTARSCVRSLSPLLVLLTLMVMVVNGQQKYTNPVVAANTPDPGVISYLETDGGQVQYVAVVTSNNDQDTFPMYLSFDLVNWVQNGFVFPNNSPNRPSWAVSDFWAPEVHRINATQWNLFFTARNPQGVLSIGVAHAPSPLGPFVPQSKPLIEINSVPMGAIDATYFEWQGAKYLIWKEDGNAVGKPTPININQLSADGLSILNTTATQLITNDQPWEGAVTEVPWIIHRHDYFYLFYSGNAYNTPSYAVGVARSKSLMGPFVKYPNPILHTQNSTSEWQGPGHCSVLCPRTQQSPVSTMSQCYMI